MSKYLIRYGRNIKLSDFDMCRIEIQEEFDEKDAPDRKEALMQVARMVEGFCIFRKKYPKQWIPSFDLEMQTALGD